MSEENEPSAENETPAAAAKKSFDWKMPLLLLALIVGAFAYLLPGSEPAIVNEPLGRATLEAVTPEHTVTYTVVIEAIDILNDCDQLTDFAGDFYYKLSVDGRQPVTIPRTAHFEASDGDSIPLGARRLKKARPDDRPIMTLEGYIIDADHGFSGKDDVLGPISEEIDLFDDYQKEQPLTIRIDGPNADKCAVNIRYSVTRYETAR